MVTAMFTETLGNFHHSTWFIREIRSCTLYSSENTKDKNLFITSCQLFTKNDFK
jgi:hypothetical protein